jgi:hypothetical protein
MSRRAGGRRPRRQARGSSRRRRRWSFPWPSASLRKRWWRAFRRAPWVVQIAIGLPAVCLLALIINGLYQVIRKPSELFFPVSGTLYKTPSETWREYAPLFKQHATPVITADFLAAMAQVEGSGNPVVRTYWRWSWTAQPFEMYRPASSAVGMYQITDGNFTEARRLCIHDHKVVDDGPWNDWQSCWFNGLYARVIPSNAVEMTAAYLDRTVNNILAHQRLGAVPLARKQSLAAVIHLCGAGAADAYAQRGLRLTEGQRCGDHEVRAYIARMGDMQREFRHLAEREDR